MLVECFYFLSLESIVLKLFSFLIFITIKAKVCHLLIKQEFCLQDLSESDSNPTFACRTAETRVRVFFFIVTSIEKVQSEPSRQNLW